MNENYLKAFLLDDNCKFSLIEDLLLLTMRTYGYSWTIDFLLEHGYTKQQLYNLDFPKADIEERMTALEGLNKKYNTYNREEE